MRRLVRWMIVLGVLVGLVWAAASIDLRGKTAIGHGLAWWKKQDFSTWFASKEKPAPKKAPPPAKKKPPSPPAVEKDATAKRVALLERAAEAIEKDRGNPGAKTTIGEKPSASQKKALDELVSSRLPRR